MHNERHPHGVTSRALSSGALLGLPREITALHYVHPDKAPQLFIDEVAVAPTHQGHGIGRRLVETLLAHGRTLGCSEAWVLTDDAGNEAAHALYTRTGGRPSPEGSVTMYTFPLGAAEREGRGRP